MYEFAERILARPVAECSLDELLASLQIARVLITAEEGKGQSLFTHLLEGLLPISEAFRDTCWREAKRTLKTLKPEDRAGYWAWFIEGIGNELDRPDPHPAAVEALALFAEDPKQCSCIADLPNLSTAPGVKRLGAIIRAVAAQRPDYLADNSAALHLLAAEGLAETRLDVCAAFCKARLGDGLGETEIPWDAVADIIESADEHDLGLILQTVRKELYDPKRDEEWRAKLLTMIPEHLQDQVLVAEADWGCL